ncbi:MAG TPA: ergothioneine biosynthesis protein EgtB [Rubricoccaceae bacterium]|jgi:ergothioneine biosynthesis protein EgtB
METATATTLAERFRAVRALTESLTAGLQTEDYVVQSMADVSPTKWHLAHTTWFWETFVLVPYAAGYALHDPRYPFLFNSYYTQAGPRHCRAQRGYLSRPTVAEVFAYRAHVTQALGAFLDTFDEHADREIAETVEIGLNHEQQHQELMLTDLKHVFSVNPLRPAYREAAADPGPAGDPGPMRWCAFEAGIAYVGATGEGETTQARFHFDNEGPRHRQFVEAFELADRLVTAGEVAAFVADGGYARQELWLMAGWATAQAGGWQHPFYWEPDADAPLGWRHATLAGTRPVDPNEPAVHLSYYEADAIARWFAASGRVPDARLPSEFEWEVASQTADLTAGSFVESGRLHPAPALPAAGSSGDGAPAAPALRQMMGEVWQWTHSQYTPYPGYAAGPGALGEYNGKFMANQFVLRGASVATSRTHARATYRNFFPPETTWQFTGLRLARSV